VAVPDSASPSGWRMFSGNQLGALLLSAVAENRAQAGQSGTLSSSLVSSPIISTIATHNGLRHWECPTGFKWISRAPGIVAGFEEALGYLVTPHVVSDKDGISAAALALMIAGVAKQDGGSLDTVLHQVMDKYGAFSSDQVTVRLDSPAEAASLMSALRARHSDWSTFFNDSDVVDFLHSDDSFPPADMVRFTTRDGGRVIFRPSGTEPKLKIYVDAFGVSLGDAEQKVATLAAQARKVIDILGGEGEKTP
jgi:phosphomannomutase